MHQVRSERYKVFPPGRRNLRLPTSSRAAALSTLALWSPCRRRGLLLQRVGWLTIARLGIRFLPGAVTTWDPPWEAAAGGELAARWRATIGDFDAMGIYERPQSARQGFALLLLSGGGAAAFVKLRAGDPHVLHPALAHEHRALELLMGAAPTAFDHPRPLDVGTVEGWSYLMTSALQGGLDRPAVTEDATAVIAAVRASLTDLPRDDDVAPHWEPMHGDLTPWNLRVRRDGTLSLVDWEDAAWGPPDADAVLLHASRRALFGVASPPLPREAAEHWLDQIGMRPPDRVDDRLRRDLVAALQDIAAGPS